MIKKFHYEEIDSTQDQARKLLNEFDDNDYLTSILITADKQSKGRGRFARTWQSPKNSGLYMTVIQKLNKNILEEFESKIEFAEKITREKTLTVIEAIKNFFVVNQPDINLEKIYLKPINDIYYGDKKLAGILTELINHNAKQYLITGIGINLQKIILEESIKGTDGKNAEAISLAEIFTEQGQELSLDKIALAEYIAEFLKKHLEKY